MRSCVLSANARPYHNKSLLLRFPNKARFDSEGGVFERGGKANSWWVREEQAQPAGDQEHIWAPKQCWNFCSYALTFGSLFRCSDAVEVGGGVEDAQRDE